MVNEQKILFENEKNRKEKRKSERGEKKQRK